jgi:hypothetical protein
MAREDFLGCLSKARIEKVGSSLRALPRPRDKDRRAKVIKQAFSEVARHTRPSLREWGASWTALIDPPDPCASKLRRIAWPSISSSIASAQQAAAIRLCDPPRWSRTAWRRYLNAAAHAPSLVDLRRVFGR